MSGLVNDNSITSTKIKSKDKLETKLVAELKERGEQYQRKQKGNVPNMKGLQRNEMQFYHPDKPIFTSRSNVSDNDGSGGGGGGVVNTHHQICNKSGSGSNSPNKVNNRSVDHVSQLVCELAETMNMPKVLHGDISRKSAIISPKSESNGLNNTKNFKAQLKKVDARKMTQSNVKDDTNSIVDFKSRLRRVENNNDTETIEATLECKKIADSGEPDAIISTSRVKCTSKRNGDLKNTTNDNENIVNSCRTPHNESKVFDIKKTEVKSDLAHKTEKKINDTDSKVIPTATNDDDEKRKSTGSISSLKKLWEAKDGSGSAVSNNELQTQLSPKITSQSIAASNNNKNSDEDFDSLNSIKKPIIPTKPLKLVSIYATPVQVKLNTESHNICNNVSPTSSSVPTTTNNLSNNNATVNAHVSRETILDLIQLLECTLKIPINSISASQWLQLSEKLNILQNACVTFADKATMAPHSKFQFRELVTRIENQSRSLRTAGTKNIQDNEKLVYEVGQSLKQISNALHR